MSPKMECHSKRNFNQNIMSLEIECHFKWNVTQNEFHSNWNVTQIGMALKVECQ